MYLVWFHPLPKQLGLKLPYKAKFEKLGQALDYARMEFLYGSSSYVSITDENWNAIVKFYPERK